jgi:VanZ family protein
MEKVVVFAGAAFLVFRNLSSVTLMNRSVMAWAAVTLFSLSTEAGKLLFVGRVPNIENVLVSSIGALGGVLLIPPISKLAPIKRAPIESLMLLSLIVLAYAELSPFDWIQSVDELRVRITRIEWFPLLSYYSADPQSAVFDLGKKLFLMVPLGFLLAAKSPKMARCRWSAAVIGALIGIMLEACQILLRTRTPSVTDTLTFGIAAWIGAVLFERYQAITGLKRDVGEELDQSTVAPPKAVRS